jgi:hypothetical protein
MPALVFGSGPIVDFTRSSFLRSSGAILSHTSRLTSEAVVVFGAVCLTIYRNAVVKRSRSFSGKPKSFMAYDVSDEACYIE